MKRNRTCLRLEVLEARDCPAPVVVFENATPTANSFPGLIAAGPDGNQYFIEVAGNRIGKVSPSGAITEFVLPTGGAFNVISGIAVGSDGFVYFGMSNLRRVGRVRTDFDPATYSQTPDLGGGSFLSGLAATSNGSIVASDIGFDRILRFAQADLTAQVAIQSAILSGGASSDPQAITFSPTDNNVYFFSNNSRKVGRLTQDFGNGAVATESAAASVGPQSPNNVGITVGADGNVWFTLNVAAAGTDFLGNIPLGFGAGAVVGTRAITDNSNPFAVASGSDGNLYVTEFGLSRLGQLNPFTNAFSDTFVTLLAGSSPVGIALGQDGNMYFTESGAPGRVGKLALDHLFAVGADAGAGPQVNAYNGDGSVRFSFFAYAQNFTGGVRVATGDVTGDGIEDIITGAGPGAPGGHVKVFDGRTGAERMSFLAFQGFTGGIFVAAGDVNNDGFDDIIVGAGAGAPGGHVKVFSGADGSLIRSFLSFTGFTGGVTVASGDINNDGFDDIIVGAGPGAPGGHVKVFSGANHAELRSFFAYGQTFTGGVFVGGGDVNNDGFDDIITGAGFGGQSHVKVFSGATHAELASFLAFPGFNGAVRVAGADLNNDGFADIVVGVGPGAQPAVKVFSGLDATVLQSFFAFDPAFRGGVYVG